LSGVLDVQDALHAQQVGAAIGHQGVERRRHRRPAHRLVEGHAKGPDAVVVAVDVVRVLVGAGALGMVVLVAVIVSVVVVPMMMAVPMIVAAS